LVSRKCSVRAPRPAALLPFPGCWFRAEGEVMPRIAEQVLPVTGGVDTHAGVHVEQLSIPVDRDRLCGCGRRVLVGSFDELAALEAGPSADQGNEVRRVHGTPAVLG
jgi:hypothetical protein